MPTTGEYRDLQKIVSDWVDGTDATSAPKISANASDIADLKSLLDAFNAEDFSTSAKQDLIKGVLDSLNAKDFATETKLETIRVLLNTISGIDFATSSKQDTAKAVLDTIAGKDFATQTTLAALNTAFGNEDFSTETTLSSVLTKLTELDNKIDAISNVDSMNVQQSGSNVAYDEVNDLRKINLNKNYIPHEYKKLDYQVIAVEKNGDKVFAKASNDVQIYRSLDNGETWQLMGNTGVTILSGHYTQTGNLILFTNNNTILVSQNDGETYTETLTNAVGPLINGIDSDGDTVIFGEYTSSGAVSSSLYKSTNGGLNWNKVLELNDILHFHTVAFLKQINSRWIATTGDSEPESRMYESVSGDSGTWVKRAEGNEFRTVGIAGLPHKTLIWGADQASTSYIYAGVWDNLDNTTQKIASIEGHTLGIAGSSSVLFLGTRMEITNPDGNRLTKIYVSYDAGKTWQIEYQLAQTNSSGGILGILGPDRKGNFYISANYIEGESSTITIKASPKYNTYNKPIIGFNNEFTEKPYLRDILTNEQIRQNTSVVYGKALPFDVYEPVIEIRNTLDQSATLRMTNIDTPGFFQDVSGTKISPVISSDQNNATFITKNDLNNLNTIPAGTDLGIFCSIAPTSGDITVKIYGKILRPVDHRNLEQ